MAGHKQQIGPNKWRFYVDAAPDPLTKKRRQRTKTFTGTAREADIALAGFVTEAAAGQLDDVDKITVAQLIDKWVAHNESSWEPNTLRGYRSKIKLIDKQIGTRPISEITTYVIDALYRHLQQAGAATNSILGVHRILHAAFEQARRWKWRTDNPITDTTVPAAELEEPDDDDVDTALIAKAIAAAAERERTDRRAPALHEAAWLAAVTGCRESELCGLRWSDLDRVAHTIRVQRRVARAEDGSTPVRPMTKNKTRRRLGLDRRTVAMLRLRHYKARQRARTCKATLVDDAYILSETPDGSTPLSPLVLSQRWSRHRDRLGINVTFHNLRKWHVSVLEDAGVPRSRQSKRVGHTREQTTADFYTKVLRPTDHDLAEIAARRLR